MAEEAISQGPEQVVAKSWKNKGTHSSLKHRKGPRVALQLSSV